MSEVHAKIIVIGDATVGKSSIRKRYLGQGFHASHMMTLGADFASKTIRVKQGFKFIAQIWDLAGQPQFAAIRARFYLGASGVMMVYDVTNPNSFYNIEKWLLEMRSNVTVRNFPILIVGNKIDLKKERKIKEKDARKYIEGLKRKRNFSENLITYEETSALDGTNIDEAFNNLAELITENLKKN